MILIKNHTPRIFLVILILYLSSLYQVFGQKNILPGNIFIPEQSSIRQDTAAELRKRNILTAEQPDTNFTWEKYGAFLSKISDTSKYIVLPINEFRNTLNSKKIVIGLRHDVDIDLNTAYQFSEIESKLGFRSTYFILHTAPYYLANPGNMGVHSQNIIPILKTMQDDRKFEIGWHNDLVTLQVIYNINPVTFLQNELAWLRSNGLNIIGTAAHGSNYCKVYHYMNFYFFEEYTYPVVPNRENNISVPVGGINIPIIKGRLGDFNLEYEAYFLNNNKAFSDATITNGVRWDIGMLDLKQLKEGDRVIILLHPIHWHKASVNASIESFRINGQRSSVVYSANSTVSVIMPYGTDRRSLSALFTLSPGAYAKVSGKLQVNGSTLNNFNDPLTYTVYAENRDIHKEWTVNVTVAKNSAANFESFVIPDMTKSVIINNINKTIILSVKEGTDLSSVPVQFKLSSGARAWIGNDEQFSNAGTIDLSNTLTFKVVAEDGLSSCKWTVTAHKPQSSANFISFKVPGLIGKAIVDTVNNTIGGELDMSSPVNYLKASFELSANARAWIGKQEQVSDVSINNFNEPVIYEVVSKDSINIKKWKVTLKQAILSALNTEADLESLTIYPNPSDGKLHLQFRDIKVSSIKINVFNTLGEKVYTELIEKTGSFTAELDLTKLPPGIYFVKWSESEKPEIIILQDR